MPDINETLETRGGTHGVFAESAITVQRLKETMHQAPNWKGLSAAQKEALEMAQHKIGRILHGDPNFADHWADIIGYIKLVEPK